ncbi:MAG: ceramidase domain-containing protein [Myxococcota bacterium]|nr:ceramidase domain-containing protein [Myxococcota bacterium]
MASPKETFRRYWGLMLGSLFTVFFLPVLIAGPWTGATDRCFKKLGDCDSAAPCSDVADVGCQDCCWCEEIRDGASIKQPQNTWSDLGFLFAGLAILFIVSVHDGRPGHVPEPRNLLTDAGFHAHLYGLAVLLMGPGSMVFHASMGFWPGFLDSVSMLIPVLFILWLDLSRFSGFLRESAGPQAWFWFYVGSLVLACAGIYALKDVGPASTIAVVVLVMGVVCVDLAVLYSDAARRHYRRSTGWFWTGLGTFLAGVLVWILSMTDMPLCNPDGLQGHLVWHLVSAAAMFLFFFYLRSERKPTADELAELGG